MEKSQKVHKTLLDFVWSLALNSPVLVLASAILATACAPQIRFGGLGAFSSSTLSISLPQSQVSFSYTVGDTVSIAPASSISTVLFSISPALPSGLSLNSVTGVISGTAAVSQSTTVYTLSASDSTGDTASYGLSITIYLAPTIAVVGSPFVEVQNTAITPVTPTLSSSVSQVTISPALPSGLSLAPTTGVISGTPSVVTSATSYTLTAVNPAGASLSTTISLEVDSASAEIAYNGSPFFFTTGDTVSINPSLQVGVITISPALTNGLSMNTSGQITGTATGTLAQTTYTLTATNGFTAQTTIQIEIVAPPVIAYTGSPFIYTKGTPVSLTPSTLTSVVSTSISPSLPTGLSISPTTGVISGTPTVTSAQTTYTLTATNAAGRTSTTTIQITVNDVAPLIGYTGSPFTYTTGQSVNLVPTTTSGVITISPALTNGLSMSATGTISGTVTGTLAQTTYTVTATNSTGQTATATIQIQIVAAPVIAYTGSPFTYTIGTPVSLTPSTLTSVVSTSISPALPGGLSISPMTGVISGTPTTVSAQTTYTITATNLAGAISTTMIQITVTDTAPLIAYSGSPLSYEVGASASITPTSVHGTITISPALTNGLSINSSTGVISGTVTGSRSDTTYTVTATNGNAQTASTTIEILILAGNTPILLVQTASYSASYGSVTNPNSITLPSNPFPGDFIALSVSGAIESIGDINGMNGTDNFGNNYSVAVVQTDGFSNYNPANYNFSAILYASNIAYSGSGSLTISLNLPNLGSDTLVAIQMFASEFEGVALSSPLDATGSSSSTTATAMPATLTSGNTSTATTQNYELLLSNFTADDLYGGGSMNFANNSSPAFTPAGTQSSAGSNLLGQFAYSVVSSTGTYSSQLTISNPLQSDSVPDYSGVIATFKGLQTTSGYPAATKIAFSSSAQTLSTHTCSGSVTLTAQTNTSAQAMLSSSQAVSLSGTGLTFYQDSACTVPITQIQMPAESLSSSAFYFEADKAGSIALTATPASLTAASQNQTISLINGTWLGTAGDGQWTTTSNWQGHAVPSNAYFDDNCTSCNVTIDEAFSYITTFSTYTGTITDNYSSSFTNANGGVNLGGGTFTSSSTNSFMYTLQITGGTFIAPTGTLEVGQVTFSSPGAFNANGGTVQLGFGTSGPGYFFVVVSSGTLTFNNLHFYSTSTSSSDQSSYVIGGTVNVSGNVTLDNADFTTGYGTAIGVAYPYNTSNINIAGNLIANSGAGNGGYPATTFTMAGNNAAQTITGSANGYLPVMNIAQTGTSTLDLSGTIVASGWNYTSGTVNAGSSTVQIGSGNSTYDTVGEAPIDTGSSMAFNNLVVANAGDAKCTTSLYVSGNLTIDAPDNLIMAGSSSDNLYLGGNLDIESGTISNYFGPTLIFNGTGAQTITQAVSSTQLVPVVIDNVGGSVTLDSSFTSNDLTVEAGTLNLSSSDGLNAQHLTIDAGAVVNCNGGCGLAPITACSGDMQCTSLTKNGTINQ